MDDQEAVRSLDRYHFQQHVAIVATDPEPLVRSVWPLGWDPLRFAAVLHGSQRPTWADTMPPR